MATKAPEKGGDVVAPTIAFDYIKGNLFRVIHADGALAAPTPSRHIHFALFSERAAIPRRLIHALKEDRTIGEIKETESRNSIVREMDIDVIMTKEGIQQLIVCLQGAIKTLEDMK